MVLTTVTAPHPHPPKCGPRSPSSWPPVAHVNNISQMNSIMSNHLVYPKLRTTSTHTVFPAQEKYEIVAQICRLSYD